MRGPELSAMSLRDSAARSRSTCLSGPTTGMSAWRSLPISAASMSRWITRAPGANADSLPVTRSSKREPHATSRSALLSAQFDHFGPCMPGQPKKSSCVSENALLPISVVMTGSLAASASSRSSAVASPFSVPPPT